MSGRAVFDPTRLDDELAELLPPPPDAGPRTADSGPVKVDRQPAPPAPSGATPTTRSDPSATGDIRATVVAVRVPRPLYETVVRDLLGPMVEKPSYAQVIAWTCQDHPQEVQLELERISELSLRTPRGRRIAADTVPLTPRFQPAELATLDGLLQAVRDGATRTAAVVAALRVAVKQGISSPG